MAVFSLHRSRLQTAMHDAITDPAAYDKVYAIIAKHRSAPATAIELTTEMVKKALSPASTSLPRLLNRPSTSSTSPPTRSPPFSPGISPAMPRATQHAIAVLQVLHGIVLSYPEQMSRAFAQPRNCAGLLRLVLSKEVPGDVRRALATLVARWHAVVVDEGSRVNLALVVEGFCGSSGMLPDRAFLPRPPENVREALAASGKDPVALYIPRTASSATSHTASAVSANPQPADPIPPHTPPMPQSEPPLPPPPPSPQPATTEPSSDPQALTRLLQSSQELLATSSMIIDNLVALPLDDDPRTNPVIRELMAAMGHLHRACVASIARTADTQATRRLKQAIDEAKRCQWVYNDSVRAYEVWRAQYGGAVGMGGSGSASGSARATAPEQNGEGGPPEGVLSNGAPHEALVRASTRARGKMADTGASE